MLLFKILALCTILENIVQGTISKEIIAYTSEEEDEEGLAIYQHLNVSQTYHSHSHNMHDIIVKHIVITNTTSSNQLCESLGNVNFLISACKTEECQQLVTNLSHYSGLPTVHIIRRNWNFLSDSVNDKAFKNQIYLVPTTTVFYNVILDILPSLNLSTNASVLFDSAYGNMERARAFFGTLPILVNFVEIQSSSNSLQEQLQDVAAFERVIIVAKTTTTAVMVAKEIGASLTLTASDNDLFIATAKSSRALYTESDCLDSGCQENNVVFYLLSSTKQPGSIQQRDIKPFQCKECFVDLLWIRPYATGIPNMHSLREFLVNSETGLKLNYSFRSWEELDVAFYFDVMDFVFEVFNKTLNHISYSCSFPPTETLSVFDDALVELTRPEYGAFKQLNASTFYQDVRAKVFRIERSSSTKETYSKQIASWTVANKVELLYGSFDVDIKTIRAYRIVTALQSPFVQLSGDPEKPYEGFCIDLIDMIREELNFTYTIYEVEDGMYGAIEQDGRWNGLIGDLVSGSADIALVSLSATAERELAVDFTLPYYKPVGIAILMKKPDVRYSMFEFTEVLEWQVWLSIAAAYLLASITLRLFDKLSPYSNTNKRERKIQSSIDMEDRVFTFKECLWFCMTSLTSQGGGEVPKNLSGRIVAATWWLFGFIIVSSYSANLGAFLTVSRLEQSIKTLDDLAGQYKVRYAPIKGSFVEAYFRNMAEIEKQFYTVWRDMAMNESMSQLDRTRLPIWDYPVPDKYTKMWRFMQESEFPNFDEEVNLILTSEEGFAVFDDAAHAKYLILTNCQLQQVGADFARIPYAIAVQKGHVLRDQINNVIRMLTDDGRLQLLEEKWWHNNSNKAVCPETSLKNGMAIQNVGGVFILILLAITLSAMTFTIEYTYYRRSNVIIAGHH